MAYSEMNESERNNALEQFNGQNTFNSVPLSAFKKGLEIVQKLKPESDAWFARITPILDQIQANRIAGIDTEVVFDKHSLIFHADGSVTKHNNLPQ